MKTKYTVCVFALLILSVSTIAAKRPRVLLFSKTAGFYHKSIPVGIAAIQKLGAENGFDVDSTKNANLFTYKNLKRYAAVIFLSTTGTILNVEQKAAFKKYIQKGGGFVGVHAATDTEYDWPWYNGLAGAYFLSHPNQQKAVIEVSNREHISTKHLPAQWKRFDEWYNFKDLSDKIKVLMLLDEKSYEGGKNGDYHPIAWYQQYDGGRSFYTGLGHTDESFSEPLFLQHLLGGINYAMGKKE